MNAATTATESEWVQAVEKLLRRHFTMYHWSKREARAIEDFILTARFGIAEDLTEVLAARSNAERASEDATPDETREDDPVYPLAGPATCPFCGTMLGHSVTWCEGDETPHARWYRPDYVQALRAEVTRLTAALDAARGDTDKMRDTLEWASSMFDSYSVMHGAKATAEGQRKAAMNHLYAERCRDAARSSSTSEQK